MTLINVRLSILCIVLAAVASTTAMASVVQIAGDDELSVPSAPGNYEGEEVSIPYTAEYYFYRRSPR